jgi:DNA repair protein RecO (recombination protein O)
MALVKVDALILRNLRMGETSRVVTFLSRELGKSSAVAKGVRAPKSRFGASLEILNRSHLILYFRSGRDLQLVSEGTLDHEFRGLFRQSERYHYGCAVVEFLDRILEEEATVPEVFDLSLRVLGLMEDAPLARLSYLLRAFQLRVAGWLGYAPRLDRCAGCGRDEAVGFGPAEGGVLCGRCAGLNASSLPLSAGTLELLRTLAKGSLPRAPSVETTRQLDQVAESFLSFHIGRYRGLRSLQALGDLGRRRRPQHPPVA